MLINRQFSANLHALGHARDSIESQVSDVSVLCDGKLLLDVNNLDFRLWYL